MTESKQHIKGLSEDQVLKSRAENGSNSLENQDKNLYREQYIKNRHVFR